MKTLLRWLFRTLLALLVLLVLCIAALVAANWRDDPLTPEAARLLAPPAPPASGASNAYYVLMGMDAPEGEDALAAGWRWHSDIDRQFRENPARTDYSEPPRIKTTCLRESTPTCDWGKLHCPLKGADCVNFYLSEKDRGQRFMAEQSVLRQRYQEFSRIPVFDEPPMCSMYMPIPSYRFMAQAAEMNLMAAVLDFDKGDLAAGAQTLMQEIRVHLRLLANGSLLVTKMIAVSMLRRDYAVLSDAIEHWPPLARQAELTEAWHPLSAREYDLRPTIASEAILQAYSLSEWIQSQQKLHFAEFARQAMKEPYRSPWYVTLSSYFILPHATLNTFARWSDEDAQAIDGDAATIEARHAAQIARREREFDQISPWSSWRFIRNPGGKILLFVGTDYFTYAERIHDIDGYIRLVVLQAALRRDDVPLTEVADYMQHVAPDLRNPYDGQLMRWDAASNTISFEGRQKNNFNPEDTPKTFSVRLRFESASTHQEKPP